MGLKRHPALQPFSRDHLIGLFHAQKLIKSESSEQELVATIESFSKAWEREITVHFADEDRLLGPLAISKDSLNRLDKEHIELSALILKVLEPPYSASLAARAGRLLDAHIRWEEHELFPEIESQLSPSELNLLGKQTEIIEKSRRRSL